MKVTLTHQEYRHDHNDKLFTIETQGRICTVQINPMNPPKWEGELSEDDKLEVLTYIDENH